MQLSVRLLLVYQAFRWWGVGTSSSASLRALSVYQAFRWWGVGTSSPSALVRCIVYQAFRWWGVGTEVSRKAKLYGVYQAFRWWGVGTRLPSSMITISSVSGIPMVGCRNIKPAHAATLYECIRHSDGGVSEHGYSADGASAECIRHSDGGVSELHFILLFELR